MKRRRPGPTRSPNNSTGNGGEEQRVTDDAESSRLPVPAPTEKVAASWRSRLRRPTRAELLDWLASRYGRIPAWVLLVQFFLAAGWLRAASAHGLSIDWWTGAEVTEFRHEHETVAIDWYRDLMLDGPVALAPFAIAGIVMVGQLVVACLLALQYRTLVGLGLGAFLNVNFVLAGAVDPSAFYLVLGAALAMWHTEAVLSTARCWWLTLVSTVVGFTFVGALAPEITTVDPAAVIDDPAMVLTFITLLWIAGLWITFGRRVALRGANPPTTGDAATTGQLRDGRQRQLAPGDQGAIGAAARRVIDGEAPEVPSASLRPPPPEGR